MNGSVKYNVERSEASNIFCDRECNNDCSTNVTRDRDGIGETPNGISELQLVSVFIAAAWFFYLFPTIIIMWDNYILLCSKLILRNIILAFL